MTLSMLYEKYKEQYEKFQHRRREIMKEPELAVHEAAVELHIYDLKRRLESEISDELNRAWEIYDEIWSGDPNEQHIKAFLEIAIPLQQFKEFLTPAKLDVLKASCNLIEAYSRSFSKE